MMNILLYELDDVGIDSIIIYGISAGLSSYDISTYLFPVFTTSGNRFLHNSQSNTFHCREIADEVVL